jgi:hypothetical protein
MLPYIKTSGSLVRSEKASASTFKLHKQAPLGDRPSAVEAVTVFARAAGANVRDAEHCEDLTFQAWSSNFGASNLRPRRPYAANSSPSAEISFLSRAHTRESVRAPADLCRVRLGLPCSGAVESVVKLSPKYRRPSDTPSHLTEGYRPDSSAIDARTSGSMANERAEPSNAVGLVLRKGDNRWDECC